MVKISTDMHNYYQVQTSKMDTKVSKIVNM